MIASSDLDRTARSYLRAARLLNQARSSSPDVAIYLCGYAVEIALKARICRTLGWPGYPSSRKEFEGYTSFQTHNMDVLLHLAGRNVEDRIRTDPSALSDWSLMEQWKPEQRYHPLGTRTAAEARGVTDAARRLLSVKL